jgi:hypothetical protein
MPGIPPPPDFGRAKLEIETVPPGQTLGRIYWSTYPDPLGYGKSPSRFRAFQVLTEAYRRLCLRGATCERFDAVDWTLFAWV